MRRTALALFVVEPTHLRCEKLGLVQTKSKFRLEARVGGFSVGVAASRIACEFELLTVRFLPELLCGEGCPVLQRERGPEALGMDEFAGRLKHGP